MLRDLREAARSRRPDVFVAIDYPDFHFRLLPAMHELGIPVKVVLTSGFSESYLRLAEGVAKFHENPNVSVLRKPFRREELVRLLTELTAD